MPAVEPPATATLPRAIGRVCPSRGGARGGLLALLAALIFGQVSVARAYCRQTTASKDSACPDVCETAGIPVAWESDPVYALGAEPIPGMDPADQRRIVDESFGAWTQVLCDGRPIDLRVEQSQEPAVEPDLEEPDLHSAVVYHSEAEWRELFPGYSSALALTVVASDDAGRIWAADMHLNGGVGGYTECLAADRCADANDVDLGNVVTHEAGHFFGLGHSEVRESTMHCDSPGWEVANRTLSDDDVAGICAIYGPQAEAPSATGCSGAGGREPQSAGWLGLVLSGLWLQRRRGCRGQA